MKIDIETYNHLKLLQKAAIKKPQCQRDEVMTCVQITFDPATQMGEATSTDRYCVNTFKFHATGDKKISVTCKVPEIKDGHGEHVDVTIVPQQHQVKWEFDGILVYTGIYEGQDFPSVKNLFEVFKEEEEEACCSFDSKRLIAVLKTIPNDSVSIKFSKTKILVEGINDAHESKSLLAAIATGK